MTDARQLRDALSAREPTIDERGIKPPPAFALDRVDGTPEGVVLVRVEGEVDLAAAADLRRFVDDAAGSGARALVLDLTEMDFMDSSILKELLRARAVLGRSGARVVLVGLPEPARRLLDLTRTAGLFELTADRAAGLAVAAGGSPAA